MKSETDEKKKPLVIKYQVYRGELEPVTEQTAAEVALYDNYLELIYNYTFTDYETKNPERRLTAITVPKHQIAVETTVYYHENDPDKNLIPRVQLLINGSYHEFIHVKEKKEAYKIYNTIKKWLIQ